MNDLRRWFERKINYKKQEEDELLKRKKQFDSLLKESKLKLKTAQNDEEMQEDNVLDTLQYTIVKRLQPTVVILTYNLFRCIDIE